ncbi:endochitinase-like isoform X1 [Penaeus japonicus]|uniref:endochitinase-like isoform X1 n=1 Tax=Penaeus japonicus TaxID=27405 RepID=UPI001C70E181|nr:endochitinase-like isoform X1 [Penaeus japonicus]
MADQHGVAVLWLLLMLTCGLLQQAQVLVSGFEPETQPGKAARRVCYYQAGTVHRPGEASYKIEDIPGVLCSHIIYAFADLSNVTWEVMPSNPSFDIDAGGYERFVGLKDTYPDLTATIGVGGGGSGTAEVFSQMASRKEQRDVFVQSIVDLVKRYNFDGVDVDWEYPDTPEDKENFRLLMDELRAALDAEAQSLELTMAVPIVRYRLHDGYSVPELCRAVDAVHLMGYDLRGVWNDVADVHSMLYRRPDIDFGILEEINLNDGSLLWEELGCPRDKLVLGVPFYGRSFTLADPSQHTLHAPITGSGNPGPIIGDPTVLVYFEICTNLKNDPEWKREWDNEGLVPYTYKGDQWIGYEDPESLKIKMDYIRKMGYLGAMNWAIDDDDFKGWCGLGVNPMMTAIYEGLKNYTVPRSKE